MWGGVGSFLWLMFVLAAYFWVGLLLEFGELWYCVWFLCLFWLFAAGVLVCTGFCGCFDIPVAGVSLG